MASQNGNDVASAKNAKYKEILVRMLNERSLEWELTPERLETILDLRDKTPSSQVYNILSELFPCECKPGSKWPITVERIKAIQFLINESIVPPKYQMEKELEDIKRGAAADRCLEKPWVKRAIELLGMFTR